MDITLERILSLIPKKPDGSFVHGAKKEFSEQLNLSHNLVTMWISGKSRSYEQKLYEISDKYNVSVEWLKGETDIKEKLVPTNGNELLERYGSLSSENQVLVKNLIEQLAKSQSEQ